MKYRSFNEEFLIATALIINVFNDIIIDRRRRGGKRDFSKAISLKDIAQQEIEIPCIIGDRSHILRSLENEAGKYKLPLIILSNKSIKTDTVRIVDLHNDVFYQQDNQFAELDVSNPHYKPQQLSKRRAQPVNMDFDMTILTRYKEDMDQILSNWIVFFKPDVYVKWWNPRRENETINSQIIWTHSIGHELPIEYNPTNVFTYKSTTSFTFKTWLFPGMNMLEHKIDPETEKVIKKFKFFPNRGDWWDEEDDVRGEKDSNFDDDSYYFGEIYKHENTDPIFDKELGAYIDPIFGTKIDLDEYGIALDPETGKILSSEYDLDNIYGIRKVERKNEGQLGMYGLTPDQEFFNNGDDPEGLKSGKYMVNNVFYQNSPLLSSNAEIATIGTNPLFSDTFSNYDKNLINQWNEYQNQLIAEPMNDYAGTAFIKNVYFKGGFPEEAALEMIPSGDLLYRRFCKSYTQNDGKHNEKYIKANFGDNFINTMSMTLNYNIDNKNLTLSSSFNDDNYQVEAISIFNSNNGIYQKFKMDSLYKHPDKQIKFNFERTCDSNFDIIQDKSKNQTKNVILFNKLIDGRAVKFKLEESEFKNTSRKLLNIISVYKNAIDLNEFSPGQFEMIINDSKIGKILKEKDLYDINFRSFSVSDQTYLNGNYYQVLLNRYMYLVIKTPQYDPDNPSIYDYGVVCPLGFSPFHAPLFEITIPESKMLLGFTFKMEI